MNVMEMLREANGAIVKKVPAACAAGCPSPPAPFLLQIGPRCAAPSPPVSSAPRVAPHCAALSPPVPLLLRAAPRCAAPLRMVP